MSKTNVKNTKSTKAKSTKVESTKVESGSAKVTKPKTLHSNSGNVNHGSGANSACALPSSCMFTGCALVNAIVGCYMRFACAIKRYFAPFFALFVRIWIARIFWYSGIVKVTDWNATLDLFKNEYKVPDISPIFAAYSAATFEIACSVLLAFGFMTRLAAVPLFVMSIVIFKTYDMSIEPLYWAVLLGSIFVYGPGCLSIDGLIGYKYGCKKTS